MAKYTANLLDLLTEEEKLISELERLECMITNDLYSLDEEPKSVITAARLKEDRNRKEDVRIQLKNVRKRIKQMICRILQDY
jgi:hypothetical protein